MTDGRTTSDSFWAYRFVWGLKAGFTLAAILSACAVVLFLLEGSQPFPGIQMPLPAFLLVYAINPVIGGLILGLSRPILGTAAGCAGVGLTVGLAQGATFGFVDPRGHWSGLDTVFTGSFGFTGLLSGILTYRKMRRLDMS